LQKGTKRKSVRFLFRHLCDDAIASGGKQRITTQYVGFFIEGKKRDMLFWRRAVPITAFGLMFDLRKLALRIGNSRRKPPIPIDGRKIGGLTLVPAPILIGFGNT